MVGFACCLFVVYDITGGFVGLFIWCLCVSLDDVWVLLRLFVCVLRCYGLVVLLRWLLAWFILFTFYYFKL